MSGAVAQSESVDRLPPRAGRPDWPALEEMVANLPPGIPLLPENDAGNFAKYDNPPPHIYLKDEAWQNCVRAMEKHDSVLCRGYREEIDTLLVFAGLFSAVVTAFSIESYQWLQDDPQEALVVLLSQIAATVATNGTATTVPSNFGLPPSVSARINIYWFMALALSLSAALIGILCKQWIREFERYVGASARDIVALRQMKFDGLENWKVGDIIAALPLLLQLSLALFALGVLELLWRLHVGVAAAVCVPTIAALLVYLATTFLPVIQHRQCWKNEGSTGWRKLSQCPYKSPQTLLAFHTYSLVLTAAWRFRAALSYLGLLVSQTWYRSARRLGFLHSAPLPSSAPWRLPPLIAKNSWSEVDRQLEYFLDVRVLVSDDSLPGSLFRGLAWLDLTTGQNDVREWIWNCLWEEAVHPNRRYSLEWLRRGIVHALGEDLAAPSHELAQAEPRSLALLYLDRTSLPPEFITEAFLQNLSHMDVASATYYLREAYSPFPTDARSALSLLRVFIPYARQRLGEDLGPLLVEVTKVITACSDPDTRWTLRGCIVRLYLNWCDNQNAPRGAQIIDSTDWVLYYHLSSLQDYLEHPERLRESSYAHEMAALVNAAAHMSGRTVTVPSAGGDVGAYFPRLHAFFPSPPGYYEKICSVLLELLILSNLDAGQDTSCVTDLEGPPVAAAVEVTASHLRSAKDPFPPREPVDFAVMAARSHERGPMAQRALEDTVIIAAHDSGDALSLPSASHAIAPPAREPPDDAGRALDRVEAPTLQVVVVPTARDVVEDESIMPKSIGR